MYENEFETKKYERRWRMSIEVRALEVSGNHLLPVQPIVARHQSYSSFSWSDATVPGVRKTVSKLLEAGPPFLQPPPPPTPPVKNNKVESDE